MSDREGVGPSNSETPVTAKCKPSDLEKLQFEYAWRWFAFHAEQRTKMFNYMILVVGILANGIVLAIGKSFLLIAADLSFIGAIFSFAFFFLDLRNRNLTWLGEEILAKLEREVIFGEAEEFKTRKNLTVPLGLLWRQAQPVSAAHQMWYPSVREALEGKHRFWLPVIALVFAVSFLAVGIMLHHNPTWLGIDP